jgi:hypothetical protein
MAVSAIKTRSPLGVIVAEADITLDTCRMTPAMTEVVEAAVIAVSASLTL